MTRITFTSTFAFQQRQMVKWITDRHGAIGKAAS